MKGGVIMRLVNPVGREVGTGMEASYDLRACYCNSGFAGEKGTHDNCTHCGCNCNSTNDSTNDGVADSTPRAS